MSSLDEDYEKALTAVRAKGQRESRIRDPKKKTKYEFTVIYQSDPGYKPHRFDSLKSAFKDITTRYGKLYHEGNFNRRPSGGQMSTVIGYFWRSKAMREFDRTQRNRATSVAFISARTSRQSGKAHKG